MHSIPNLLLELRSIQVGSAPLTSWLGGKNPFVKHVLLLSYLPISSRTHRLSNELTYLSRYQPVMI